VQQLERLGVAVRKSSSVFETEPVEVSKQPDFLNICFQIATELSPHELLETCLAVETSMGRIRNQPKGPRIIDIDVLFYGQLVSRAKRLSIPHPAFSQRKFVLVPMVEIAPSFRDPISGSTMEELLNRCPDQSAVNLLEPFTLASSE
jgi:2-amino-4-hydroxy-6-hydroxymethyldihydropteridine diphosphokinase